MLVWINFRNILSVFCATKNLFSNFRNVKFYEPSHMTHNNFKGDTTISYIDTLAYTECDFKSKCP